MKTNKSRLALGAASAAVAVGLAAQVQAATTTSGTTVTVAGTDNTADSVNTATNAVSGSTVTVSISTGATVVQPSTALSPTQQGAVAITNRGTVGTSVAPVGIVYAGTSTSSDNTFDLANLGAITGGVSVNGVGGTVNIVNSGTIDNGIDVTAAGAVTIRTGAVKSASGIAVSAASQDDVSIAVDGTIGTAGTEMVSSALRNVQAISIGTTSTSTGPTTETVDGTTTVSGSSSSHYTGGSADVAVEAGGASGAVLAVGLASASVSVDGAVGAEDQSAQVNAIANLGEVHSASDYEYVTTATGSSYATHEEFATMGGDASVDIGEGGFVSGAVTAAGLTSAEVTVDGTVGREGFSSSVNARALGVSHSEDETGTVVNASGDYTNNFTATNARTGGTASVTVGENGIVRGAINARADGDATIDNSGQVDGALNARSNEYVSNQEVTSYNSGTFTSADGVSVDAYTSGYAFTSGNVGNAASVTNAQGASAGYANLNAIGDATLTNGGELVNGALVNSSGTTSTGSGATSETYTFTDTGEGTYRSAYSYSDETTSGSSTIGGTASVANASGGTIGNGPGSSLSVNGFAGAQVQNAGIINANVNLGSTGSDSTSESLSTYDETADTVGVTASESTYEYANASTATGGSASLTNAAGGLVGLNDESPVSVSLYANGDASVTNAGRINGPVSVVADATDTANSGGSANTFAVDRTTGVVNTSEAEHYESSSASAGGSASFANAAGGLVVGSVNVSGDAGVTVSNAGVVTGTTYASSNSSASTFAYESLETGVFTPGAEGGFVSDYTQSVSSSSNDDGGDVTGTYDGFNGAVQFTNSGASDGSVTQFANGNSTATVSGTIFGSFNGTASGSASTSTYTETTHYADDADGNTFEGTYDEASSGTYDRTGGNSSLAVAGGTITGNATVNADGDASAQLGNGAEIGGNLDVHAATFGSNSTYAEASSAVGTYVDGDLTGYTLEETSESSGSNLDSAGSVSIGNAEVGGYVSVSGAKGGATLDLASAGAIGGSAYVYAGGSDSESSGTSTTVVADGGTTVDTASESSSTANGGNVSATVAGTIGGDLFVDTNAGNATVALTGQVGSDIVVDAVGFSGTSAGTTHTDADGYVTTTESTSTPVGGTASLAVNAASLDVPASYGDIDVSGLAGSTVTIGAKSAVLAGAYDTELNVGGTYAATTSSSEFTDPAIGLATYHEEGTSTAVGGPASLTNAGTIGYDNGDDSATLASVTVASVGGATAVNTGKIFGSLSANALGTDTVTTVDQINLYDVTRVDTTVVEYTAVGGNAAITNSGLVTGSVSLAGATGTVTNSGTIGGDIAVGQSVDNYTTTSVDTLTQIGEELVTAQPEAPFIQTYTVNQNGTVEGDIRIGGAFGNYALAPSDGGEVTTAAVDTTAVDADGHPLTSVINAAVNLGNNSVTNGGVYAEYDLDTGERFTNTVVNVASTAKLGGGVHGVEKLNKLGTGVFTLTGPSYVAATDVDPAEWTLDLGQFEILTGEVQLATDDGGVFGIRGDVKNAGSLVLGTRQTLVPTPFGSNLTSTATQTIAGVDVYQQGDFVQTSSGSLTVAMMPSLVRVVDPSINGSASSNEPLGVQQILFSQGLFTTPEKAFGSQYAALYAPSSWTIDGDLDLAGTVNVLMPKGGLFLDGQSLDLFSVSGDVTENATVATGTANNFVAFDLVSRTSDGRTIVAVVADRKGYETAAANSNAAAAGAALSAALPGVVADLTADAAGTATFASVQEFALTQDLATVMAGLDSQLTLAQATQALTELGGGSYYGSIATIRTTAPFIDVLSNRRLPEGATGFNLWIQPTGDFVRTSGDAATGASKIRSDNYGGSAGFGVATGSGEFGIGFGYGRTNSHSDDGLAKANADTWMVGGYARQSFGALTVAADLVFGWSNWDAYRSLPTLSRKATADFDSKETRGDLRIEYALQTGGLTVSPFGQLELRHYSFDGFAEEGAGSVGLSVAEASKTVFTPTVGVKLGGEFETGLATIRPEASVSYSFQGDNEADRTVAFLGAPAQNFRLQGVDPDGFVTVQAGLFADIGTRSGVFVRGSYSTGGGNNVAAIRTGVVIGF